MNLAINFKFITQYCISNFIVHFVVNCRIEMVKAEREKKKEKKKNRSMIVHFIVYYNKIQGLIGR